MIQWHIVTSAEFKAGIKVAEDLYFLKDSHEIYRGDVPFTESVVMYNGTLPTEAIALNRLYIDSTTLEGKIHDGTQWKQVIKPVVDSITADGTDPVSAKAVASYVAAEIAKVAASKDTVSVLSWDAAEHLLTATMADGTTTQEITFDGLGVSLSYVADTGALQLLDASGNKIGDAINLPQEQFVKSGEYDAVNKKIILYFDAEKTNKVEIDATGLVDVYTGSDTSSASVAVGSDNVITATVKISAESGNALVLKADGLYVTPTDLSDYMTKVPDATEGHLVTLDASGQVVDSGKSFSDLASNAKVYQGASIDEALNGAIAAKGDFCIVSKPIGTSDKTELTAYHYDGENWVAFDGNYNAENVFFAEDLTTTSAVGNITLTNGQATIAAAGKNLKQVFETIFVKEKTPTTTQPSVSLTASQNKAYEVGTVVTPTYNAKLNAGSYTYGPATGIVASSWEVSDTEGHAASTNAGSFDSITVADDTNYKITAKANYEAGAIPVTNIGNAYAAGQIAAGNKSATSAAITGYRCGFYGTVSEKDAAVDSALIRALAGKTTAAPKAGDVWTLNIPVGAMRVIFAYPSTVRDVSSVLDVGGMNAEIKTAFTQYTVDVEGANGASAISYKVYVLVRADATTATNTYKITL